MRHQGLQALTTAPGHRRLPPLGSRVVRCLQTAACLGNRTQGACHEDFRGPLCLACAAGWKGPDCHACEDLSYWQVVRWALRCVIRFLWTTTRAMMERPPFRDPDHVSRVLTSRQAGG